MFAQMRKSGGRPQTADVLPSRHRLITKSTIATPRTVISSLVTPTTLVSTMPVITIARASQGPVTRAVIGTDSAARTTAAVATRPITSDASPAPPAPTSPASVTW